MFGIGRKKKNTASENKANDTQADSSPSLNEKKEEDNKSHFLSRLNQGLKKTRQQLGASLGDILIGRKEIDDDMLEELETQLLVADAGVDATKYIIDRLTQKVARKELIWADALYRQLQKEMLSMVEPLAQPLVAETTDTPFVILVVGVNGVGKTTTIGKLAKKLKNEGKSVMLAAGDTFRAAAVEQLEVWGERNNVPIITQKQGADSASVIFDAVNSAKSKNIDVLIADTAGRLHNKSNLMDELAKVVRVVKKLDSKAPHEIMIVVDATTGQNALRQINEFNKTIGLSGICVTKLDGTAKGGIIFSMASIESQKSIPVRFIGVGEQVEDLQTFSADNFVDALFEEQAS